MYRNVVEIRNFQLVEWTADAESAAIGGSKTTTLGGFKGGYIVLAKPNEGGAGGIQLVPSVGGTAPHPQCGRILQK